MSDVLVLVTTCFLLFLLVVSPLSVSLSLSVTHTHTHTLVLSLSFCMRVDLVLAAAILVTQLTTPYVRIAPAAGDNPLTGQKLTLSLHVCVDEFKSLSLT